MDKKKDKMDHYKNYVIVLQWVHLRGQQARREMFLIARASLRSLGRLITG